MQVPPLALLVAALLLCVTGCALAIALLLQRENIGLRRKLGAARTRAEAEEIRAQQLRKTLDAQSVELARYRGRLPPDMRLTTVRPRDGG